MQSLCTKFYIGCGYTLDLSFWIFMKGGDGKKLEFCFERLTLRNLNLKMNGSGEYCEEARISNAKSESVIIIRREVASLPLIEVG